jgi:hypothetical protein
MKTLFEQVQEAVHAVELSCGYAPRPFADPGSNNKSRIIREDSPFYQPQRRFEPAELRETIHG